MDYSSVRDVLTNPKPTGHMVWNRRARKGSGKNRMNPVSEWVWSPEPVHEVLVDLETFVQAQEVAEYRERSRSTSGLSRHPQARRVLLRSPVRSDGEAGCVPLVAEHGITRLVLAETTARRDLNGGPLTSRPPLKWAPHAG